jgi:hypothetical protein
LTKISFPDILRQPLMPRSGGPTMNDDRKPWLFMKRLQRWSPLADVRPMLAPMAPGEQSPEADGPDAQARR